MAVAKAAPPAAAAPAGKKGNNKSTNSVTVEARADSGRPRAATEGGGMGKAALDAASAVCHPSQLVSMPSHDAIKASPHYPIVLTPNPMAKEQVLYFCARPPNCCSRSLSLLSDDPLQPPPRM